MSKLLRFHFVPLIDLVVSVLLLLGDAEIKIGTFFLGEGKGGVFPHFLIPSTVLVSLIP